jgi:lipopolysaccharide export system protein LptC
MRVSIYILVVAIISCNTFSKEREQQSKIDSLTNEIKKRDSTTRSGDDLYKQELDTNVIIEERNSEISKNDVIKKEIPKKKGLANPNDQEIAQENNVDIKNEEQETAAATEERNAVRKRVIIEKPTFKPLTFGGFKDIKFNFFNNYSYELDEVILKVHYIRVDGTEIKSETKILKDIGANSHLSLAAPDYTSAGRELKITLEAVHCKAINLCFYSVDQARSDDPYRCK